MLKRWLEKLAGSNTLYYPGCVTRYALPEIQARYEALLQRAGVDFIVLPGETLCCGSPVKRAGYLSDFEELKAKNLAVFARFSVRKIITNCPGCYHTLQHDYGLDAYHISQVLPPGVQNAAISQKRGLTYHDPCHLGRWSGITEEPRRLLAGASWQVEELPDNRENSLCCGAGGGYVAISGLLGSQADFLEGLAYLALYNLMFVLPLIVVLVLSMDQVLGKKMQARERSSSRALRGATGGVMAALGLGLLIWML